MISSGKYIGTIIEKLNILRYELISRAKLGYTDIHLDCQNFVCHILNLTYDYNLINLNQKEVNYPSIDLGDEVKKIAFQITGTKMSKKITETISTFIEKKYYQKYAHLKVFILTEKQSSYTIDFNTGNLFRFTKDEDINDFDDLYKDILSVNVDKQKLIFDYIEKQLPSVYSKVTNDEKEIEQNHVDPEIETEFLKIKHRYTELLKNIILRNKDKYDLPNETELKGLCYADLERILRIHKLIESNMITLRMLTLEIVLPKESSSHWEKIETKEEIEDLSKKIDEFEKAI
jgi:hypothetical protein